MRRTNETLTLGWVWEKFLSWIVLIACLCLLRGGYFPSSSFHGIRQSDGHLGRVKSMWGDRTKQQSFQELQCNNFCNIVYNKLKKCDSCPFPQCSGYHCHLPQEKSLGQNPHGNTQISLLLLLLSRFSRVRLCATPQTAAHQAPLSLGFSRQERDCHTGVDCHFLLQCMKVKTESEVAQSCPTLSDFKIYYNRNSDQALLNFLLVFLKLFGNRRSYCKVIEILA